MSEDSTPQQVLPCVTVISSSGEIMRNARKAGGAAVLALCAAFALVPGSASASSTTHSVLASSDTNFSAAFERATWSLSCDTATKTWRFSINNVQVINSHGHPWVDLTNGQSGPWHVTVSAADAPGLVPFSEVLVLKQNTTNGLFTATGHGINSKMNQWCLTDSEASVVGFSGGAEPLLLDGTFG